VFQGKLATQLRMADGIRKQQPGGAGREVPEMARRAFLNSSFDFRENGAAAA